MATVNLGRIKPVFKGAYAGGTAYVVDDIVTSGNETFICILASTGNATSSATYWTKLASKGADGSNGSNGSNGTDLTSTLTTQGDILYRDGSGLQRLAKGTANQELRINSGATAPEWHTPAVASSDFVKIASTTISGTPTTVDFTGVFTSTYRQYEVYISEFYCSSGDELAFRYFIGTDSLINNSFYYSIGNEHRYNWSGNNSVETGILKSHADNKIRVLQGHTTENQDTHLNAKITFYNPQTSKRQTTALMVAGSRSASNVAVNHNRTTWFFNPSDSSLAMTGLRFYLTGSETMASGKISIYGLK